MTQEILKPSNGSAKVNILVLCIHSELGETFLQSVCNGAIGSSGDTIIENRLVHLDVLAGDPRMIPAWDEAVKKADAIAMLVRFIDVISLDKIRAIYRRIPSERAVPMSVILFREDSEIDFKMSCPACGQKLWVRDSDAGKRGRCPNCKKAFKLPSQAGHLKSQLMLPDAVLAMTVIRGKPAPCRGALASLMSYLNGAIVSRTEGLDPETLKKATVRVQISDTEG
jgi:predicted RNA-binding Zn-ribbon protein involved in translation (DUF1610 family)